MAPRIAHRPARAARGLLAAALLAAGSLSAATVPAGFTDSTLVSGLSSATQEARALSREIGYVLNAADELKGIAPS